MGLEEFFDQDSRRGRQRNEDHYRQDDPYRNEDHNRQNEYSESSRTYEPQNDMKQQFLNKLRDNPQLKMLIIVGAVIVLIIIATIIFISIFIIDIVIRITIFIATNDAKDANSIKV